MLKSGHSFQVEYVCWGWLRHAEDIEDDWYRHSNLVNGKRLPMDEDDFRDTVNWELHNVKHIDYLPGYSRTGQLRAEQKKKYAKIVKDVIASFPMFDNLRYMPKEGKVRCTVDKQNADKVVLSLMLCRNLTGYWRDTGGLKFAIDKGYPTPVAILLDTLYSRFQDFRGNCTWNFDPRNEDCLVDPATAGKKAFSDFLNQAKGYNPWHQPVFSKGTTGYWRDNDFADADEVFNPSAIEPEYDQWDDITNQDELQDTGETYFRKLVSCFSIHYNKGEEPLKGWQIWDDDLQEFSVLTHFSRNLQDSQIIEILDMFNDLYKKVQLDE